MDLHRRSALHRHGGRRPAIHGFKRLISQKSWMAGAGPAMTVGVVPAWRVETSATCATAPRVFAQPAPRAMTNTAGTAFHRCRWPAKPLASAVHDKADGPG